MNAMSAISTKGRMHFMVFTESFTAEVMCRRLDRLAGHFDLKAHLVVGPARGRSATGSPLTLTTSYGRCQLKCGSRRRSVREVLIAQVDQPDQSALVRREFAAAVTLAG